MLSSKDNRYGGTYVGPDDLPARKGDFAGILNESLNNWIKRQIKVVWIEIPLSRSELIPIAYKAGFVNHHCQIDSLIMTKRLVKNALIPHYALHTVGVGGIVINQHHQVLTIKERDHAQTMPNYWKFPGGMMDPGELFETAVCREVKEETGIETRFDALLGFRHQHQGQFGTSNIYAICRLTPLTETITIQESEIADARWFPIDEYLADPHIGELNRNLLRVALSKQGFKSVQIAGYKPDVIHEVLIAH